MAEKNEQPPTETSEIVETPTEPSSPQVQESDEPSSKLTLEFEEPDFSAITEFVEGDGGEEVSVAPTAEEVETPTEEAPKEEAPAEEIPSEELPTAEEVSEGQPKPKEEEPPVEAKEDEKEPPPEPAPVVTAVPEPVKIPTHEELQGLYAEHREKTLPVLEKLFELTDEEATALDEAPSKVIPKLAGQMMYDTMLSTYNAVISALPGIFDTYLAAASEADKAKEQFFERWPDLNQKSSAPATMAAVNAYRSANPRATLPEIIKGAGVMAMINLGLDPMKKAVEAKTPVKPKPPAKPAAPRGASPTPPVSSDGEDRNVFSDLAELFDKDNL